MDTFRVLTYLMAAAGLMSGATAQSITTQPPWFQGYWIENALTTSTLSCSPSSTFLTYGDYATCCDLAVAATGLCLPATECLGYILTLQGGSTSNCGTSWSCATIDIFPTSPVGSQVPITNVICASDWSAYTIFQDLPTTTSTSSTSTPTTSSVISTTPFSKDSSPTTTSTSTPTPTPTPHSSSKSWVAGAVIGSLAVAITLGVLGFWIGCRRAKAAALEAVPRHTSASSPVETGWSKWSPYPRYELASDER